MAKQTINTGTLPNDGTGDTLKTSFTKCNSNFTELYTGRINTIVVQTFIVSGTYTPTTGIVCAEIECVGGGGGGGGMGSTTTGPSSGGAGGGGSGGYSRK